ncbi:copper resistance CopC/CopD family protein [Natrarchaeobaculum aegyptiacum]|uniref:Copper resistance protein CopC n=1 Tax=Natrarchaeobaculum aegyptiacum TaxID=745377 RepID=A0A2Z2HWN1_9EURY|nr:copper resistance protein CopC [Natrarchaeobaculum aegyptiacum]ARS90585.1 copper resistance protein CopC [Natrarchaeobaculum aegyptiacum]
MRQRNSSSSDGRNDRSSAARVASRSLVACLLVLLVLATVTMPAAGHAYLSETDPGNGEQVDELPEEVVLSFSGDGVQVADIEILDPDGEVIADDPEIDPDDTQIVRVPVEDGADAEGMYTVEWEVLADDGHTTSGSFFFSVGDEPLDRDAVLEAYEEDETDDDLSAAEAGAKGLVLIALVGLLGAPIAAGLAVYPAAGRRAGATDGRSGVSSAYAVVDRRLATLLTGFIALLFVGVLALGFARVAGIDGAPLEALGSYLETPLGQAWLVQLGAVVAVAALSAVAHRNLCSRRTWLGGTVLGALVVTGTISWTSHSATAIDRLQGFVVDFGHIAGAGLWVGGLIVLAVVLTPLLETVEPAERRSLAAAVIRRYSLVALAGVTLAGATGLALAAWHVPSLSALFETLYGLSLSVKTLAVLLALGFGGFTRFVLLRRLEADSPSPGGLLRRLTDRGRTVREDGGESTDAGTTALVTRTVRLEVAVLVFVLLLSGLLTSAPTAAVAGDDDGISTATIEREAGDDLSLHLEALPAKSDDDDRLHLEATEPVVFEVTFTDAGSGDGAEDGGDPLESEQPVRLLATSADGETTFDVELEETDDGSYATVQTFTDEGDWELRFTGGPDGAFVSEWVDVSVGPDGADGHDHSDHDHADNDHSDHEHDHESGEHDHATDEHDEHALSDGDDAASPFTVALQFGAVSVAVLGTLAVTVESIRLRDRRP